MKRIFLSLISLVVFSGSPVRAAQPASEFLEEWLEENDLFVGYLPSEKAFVSIGESSRELDPGGEDFLAIRSEMYKIALLEAKRNILLAVEMKVSGKSSVMRIGQNGSLEETSKTATEAFASRPLVGARALRSAESMGEDGSFQVAVAVIWSPKLQKRARAAGGGTVTDAGERELRNWLRKQDYSVLVGPRQFMDSDGNFRYLGVGCAPAESAGRTESDAKKEARILAQQELVFSVKSDTAAYELAKSGFKTTASTAGESTAVWRQMLTKIEASIERTSLPGVYDIGLPKRVIHPVSRKPVYVAVVALSDDANTGETEPESERATSAKPTARPKESIRPAGASAIGEPRRSVPAASGNSEIMRLSERSAAFVRKVAPLRELATPAGAAKTRLRQIAQLKRDCLDSAAEDSLVTAIAAGLISVGGTDEFQKMKSTIPNFAEFESKILKDCRTCGGSGNQSGKCQACRGTGRCSAVGCRNGTKYSPGFNGRMETHTCPTCNGSGVCKDCNGEGIFQGPCQACRGSGRIPDGKAAQTYYYECFDDMMARCRENIVKPVHVRGYGNDEIEAVNNALIEAVGQVSGRDVRGVQRSDNGRLSRDVYVSGSKGSVRRYEIKGTKRNGDSSFEVDVIAYVHEKR